MVIWLIGMPGAGKTTLGKALYQEVKESNPSTVFLDGDLVRNIFGDDLGHSSADRYKNAWRICKLCKMLDEQQINVVCAILSLFDEHQHWNRVNYSAYYEIYIKVSLEELIKRDQKGLYNAAQKGTLSNVVGFDIPFVPPAAPDCVIENNFPYIDAISTAKKLYKEIESLCSVV